MSSEELPFTYAYKPRLMGPAYEFALSEDSLDWAVGLRTGRISYPMIKHIRLGYKPTSMANSRFIAEIWPLNSQKLFLYSVSAHSLIDSADQGKGYKAFLVELHRRVEAAKANCVYEAGFPAWRWWPSIAVAVAMVLIVIYITVQAILAAQYALAGVIVLIGGWFLWQVWNIVVRNRPRRYRFDAIPEDVLPKG